MKSVLIALALSAVCGVLTVSALDRLAVDRTPCELAAVAPTDSNLEACYGEPIQLNGN